MVQVCMLDARTYLKQKCVMGKELVAILVKVMKLTVFPGHNTVGCSKTGHAIRKLGPVNTPLGRRVVLAAEWFL